MTEANVTEAPAAKAKKPETVVTEVVMNDGRKVGFAGKRKMLKTAEVVDGGVELKIDFVNGEVRKAFVPSDDKLFSKFAAHGLSQKVGDEAAGEENVEDMVNSIDAILARLGKGEWGTERKVGDGFAGSSIVVKALVEATGKDVAYIKSFLEKKLADDKAAGGTLTRQKLYASFRQPGSKTAPIIERLEKEKAVPAAAINVDDALAEMSA